MSAKQHLVCLSLGSNIAPADNLKQALELLRQELTVLAVSRAWRTPAVGSQGPDFLNAAVLVHAPQPASQLKSRVLRDIEARLGRIRSDDKYAPRTIDIDIIVDGDQVVDPELWQYAHLAQPVAELLPDLVDPSSGQTLEAIAERLRPLARIRPCPEMLECE
jgi:2-amino-4-hydroxy-6-hydroxymethyldihydropteridine diphosphokinase